MRKSVLAMLLAHCRVWPKILCSNCCSRALFVVHSAYRNAAALSTAVLTGFVRNLASRWLRSNTLYLRMHGAVEIWHWSKSPDSWEADISDEHLNKMF